VPATRDNHIPQDRELGRPTRLAETINRRDSGSPAAEFRDQHDPAVRPQRRLPGILAGFPSIATAMPASMSI